MHEMIVAKNLLETIISEAAKQNIQPVKAKISCGALNCINDELLAFAFNAIAQNTPCQGMKLEVEHKPISGRCRNCSRVFEVKCFSPKCSKCSSEDFELLPDPPLVLEEIEF
ncbi:MAG: hydrogenase maturation nickel metallochaperone HypA [Planctomycetota bacterium]